MLAAALALRRSSRPRRVARQAADVGVSSIQALGFSPSAVLGIAPTTVRTRLHRARKALENELRALLAAGSTPPEGIELDRAVREVGSRL